VIISRPEPGVLLATLNRPDRLNALTFAMFQALSEIATEAERDPTVRIIVITGAGRGFCAGLDLDDASSLPEMSADRMLVEQEGWGRAITAFATMTKPVIAAVNGPAAGAGFSLAVAADIRLATPTAKFNAAFVKIGLSGGDCGSSWTLPRIIGLGLASEILLTGRPVDAHEAHRIGLVNRVCGPETLLEEAVSLAAVICANSPFGVRLTKQVLFQNVDAPSLAAALEVENRNQVLATRSADMSEALTAFRQKRPPRFGESNLA
jgi:enoyl-CoA hydratase